MLLAKTYQCVANLLPTTKHLYFILQGNKAVFPFFCFRVQLLQYRLSNKAPSLFKADILPPLATIELFLALFFGGKSRP